MTRLTDTIPVDKDQVIPATMFEPELTLYRDGTQVVMLAKGQPRSGVTVGQAFYPWPRTYFQVVRWEDGTEDHVAPHVLFRVRELELVLAALEPWVFMTPETVWVGVAAAQEVEVSVETVARILRALARQNKVRHRESLSTPRTYQYAPKVRD